MKKRILSLVLVTLLVLSSFSFAFGADTVAKEKTITLIHTNDTHARIEEDSWSGAMGFAKIATLIKKAKEENPNVLVVDAGDTFHGQPVVNTSKGENAVKILNAVGYDYMVPGNHDFNYGTDRLIELAGMANFKVLCANFEKEDGTAPFKPYDIKEIDGIKIGIFGLSTPETAVKTHPDNVKGYKFLDATEAAKKMVEELKDKTDIIVAIGHIGLDESSVVTSEQIIKAVDGIDVFVDGHSHSELPEGKLVNDTLIVSAQDYDKNLGFVELKFEDNKLVSKTASYVRADETKDVVPDEEVTKVITELVEANEKINSVVVTKTDIDLNGEKADVRTKETNLGNLIADAVKSATKADVALVNGGNIRASIPTGDITKGQVITVLPFGNLTLTKYVTGKVLEQALELSVSEYPSSMGGFMQVSGVTFEFDPSKEAGKRTQNILINGEPINPEKTYVVALNDFIAAGGDGYDMFKDCEQLPIEYPGYEEILIDYLNTNGTKGCDVSGRITVVAQPEIEEPTVEVTPVEPVEPEEPKVETPAVSEEAKTYTVVSGDVLWKIAQKYNTTWQVLAEYNQLKNPNLIFPGQIIKIPAVEIKPAA